MDCKGIWPSAWACLVEGLNTLVTAGVLNLPDKRVDPDCWLRSGFESPRRQLGFKPLSGSYQLRTLHCRATLICASFGGLIIYYHFSIFFLDLEADVLRHRSHGEYLPDWLLHSNLRPLFEEKQSQKQRNSKWGWHLT